MIEVISGPCSAESEEQVFATASALRVAILPKNMCISAFRAGLWKPRTRPGNFEGVGEKGLPWLKRVQDELGLKVMVEVGSPLHVEAALKAGVDMLWIGARTTADPFAMQALADALGGTDIPVFVKNPTNPDAELWIGAVERLASAGVKDVRAIHRGFSFYEKSKYRNYPKWQVPLDVQQRLPGLKMYCDPSHIAGNGAYIQELSQRALDLGFAGLFIESHISPQSALSDASQQVTPQELSGILSRLVVKDASDSVSEEISRLRETINMIDDNLLDLLAQRMDVSRKIGQCKKAGNMTVYQQRRWEEVVKRISEGAVSRGLDGKAVQELYKIIHQASIECQ